MSSYKTSLYFMQAYIYCRVSSANQTSKFFDSLDTQKFLCHELCKKNKFKIAGEYEDVGSGRNIKQLTNMNRMIKDIKNNRSDKKIIVVSDISRFARNTLQGLQHFEKLTSLSCDIYSVRDGVRYGDIVNRNTFRMRLCEAQYESEVMSIRQKNSIMMRKRMGYQFGRIPYGFKASRINGVRKFVPESNETQTIKAIIDMKQKKSHNELIATHLNQAKKFKRGKQWTSSMINNIIYNHPTKSSLYKNTKFKEALKEVIADIKPKAKKPVVAVVNVATDVMDATIETTKSYPKRKIGKMII